MRVLHVNEHLASRGGIETYLLSLFPLLEAEGMEPVFAYASGDGGIVRRAEQVASLADARLSARRDGAAAMRSVLRRVKPDVVHLHNIHNMGAVSSCLESVPTVLTLHDYRYLCPSSNLFYRRTGTICERTCGVGCFVTTAIKHCMTPRPHLALQQYSRVKWMMRSACRLAGTVAPSRYAADRLVQSGFDKARVQVTPYFCSVQSLAAPRSLPNKPRLLYMGRLSDNKGWKYFVRALGLLPMEVMGTIVGNVTADKHQMVLKEARQAGCVDRLHVRPWADRSEIADIISEATLLVFPSIWAETLGIVGLEALACGVPVIASDVGGVREWLHPGITGLLVPPASPTAIATAVQDLLASPARMMEMGQAGIELIRDRFAPDQHLKALTSLYSFATRSGIIADAAVAAC